MFGFLYISFVLNFLSYDDYKIVVSFGVFSLMLFNTKHLAAFNVSCNFLLNNFTFFLLFVCVFNSTGMDGDGQWFSIQRKCKEIQRDLTMIMIGIFSIKIYYCCKFSMKI